VSWGARVAYEDGGGVKALRAEANTVWTVECLWEAGKGGLYLRGRPAREEGQSKQGVGGENSGLLRDVFIAVRRGELTHPTKGRKASRKLANGVRKGGIQRKMWRNRRRKRTNRGSN